jgi:hypothetical protein
MKCIAHWSCSLLTNLPAALLETGGAADAAGAAAAAAAVGRCVGHGLTTASRPRRRETFVIVVGAIGFAASPTTVAAERAVHAVTSMLPTCQLNCRERALLVVVGVAQALPSEAAASRAASGQSVRRRASTNCLSGQTLYEPFRPWLRSASAYTEPCQALDFSLHVCGSRLGLGTLVVDSAVGSLAG